jgi:hypothetical protein
MSPVPPTFRALGWAGLLVGMAGTAGVARAQVPNTLRHSFFAPKTLPQAFEKQGVSVAIAGDTAVVGTPFFDADEVGAFDTGAVKVYHATGGQLLHLLENPDPAPFAYFGHAVAISGSRVVVGSGSAVGGLAYAGRVHIYDLASPNPQLPLLSLDNPSPGEYDQFGHSVAIDGDRVVVGAWLDDHGAPDAGVAYVYDLSSATPQVPAATLVNPDPQAGDGFGVAVAVSGERVVVAAYLDDGGAPDAGRAYVYDLDSPQPDDPFLVLTRPGAAANDGFGTSLAISGDRIIVGIETADASAANSGSAALFDLSSPTPGVPVVTLLNPAPAAGCYFGTSVSISGDTVAVGAYRDGSVAGNGGACHVYDLGGPAPQLPVRTLRKAAPAEGDFFGNAVSVSGSRILVGASHADTGTKGSGAAYLHDLQSATPAVALAVFSNPVAASADQFGAAVAIEGDFVAIGAPEANSRASASGGVEIHDLSAAKPDALMAHIENPFPAVGDRFGGAVAIAGGKLLVGAAGDNTGAPDAGSAYLFDLNSATPGAPTLAIPNPAPAAGDGFGAAVAISGDHLVVGAAGDDAGATDAGRAYVFHLAGATPTVPVAVLGHPSPAAGDGFGAAVAISGNRVVIGAAGDDDGGSGAGSAWVFDLAGNLLHALAAPAPQAGNAFGSAVAVSGNRVTVGAPGSDAGAADAGSAFVFDLANPLPTVPAVVLHHPAPAAGDRFAATVAASGARVVVGTALADGPADSGRVYTFNLDLADPTLPSATLAKPVPVAGDLFGAAVGIDGFLVVVGTPSDNKTAADKGAAYVFGPAAPEIALMGPAGTELNHGDPADFGPVAMGPGGAVSMTFQILNTGITGLTVSQVSVVGGDSADFTVSTVGMVSPVPAGDDTTFTVTFTAAVPGPRSTTLRIVNSDLNENLFDLQLAGRGLSPDHDSDGDGVNDVAEWKMASLGFDWQVADPALAAVFHAGANPAGFYRPDQVQSLRIPPPVLSRDPASGEMTLTLRLEKAFAPPAYQPFPLTVPGTLVNPEGELEFHFCVPDDTGYFRLETR